MTNAEKKAYINAGESARNKLIRRLRTQGCTYTVIGRRFSLSRMRVWRICNQPPMPSKAPECSREYIERMLREPLEPLRALAGQWLRR